MKKHLLLIGLTFGLFFTSTQAQDCTNGRYLVPAFTVEKIADVEYGSNFGQDGTTVENLKLDIYLPENDVDTERPVILLAHGGSFIGGNKSDLETQCTFLASLGYVTVSMQYRLINNLLDPVLIADIGLGFKKEVVRAVHDMRAAIRFLRKSFEDEGNPYGIDPDIIIVGGYSAGAILANHVAYLDDENKIPTELVDYFNDQGGLEGNTGNPGYNSTPQMVLSMCGAILDTNWIETGSQPFFGMHNTDDPTVPNLEGQPDIGIQIPVTLQGDSRSEERRVGKKSNARRRRHTRWPRDWSSDVCSSDLGNPGYNSTPQMVLSMCGAILDTNWIETGSQPFFGMHNTDDPTVPNLEGQPDIGIQIPVTLQGDS